MHGSVRDAEAAGSNPVASIFLCSECPVNAGFLGSFFAYPSRMDFRGTAFSRIFTNNHFDVLTNFLNDLER